MDKRRQSHLVSAPASKFAIGVTASLCAVLFPRLIAALTVRDQGYLAFFTTEFIVLAVFFSGLVGLVVMTFEWRVARKPRDTFLTTLGIPAMLASALSANQNGAALQRAAQTQDTLERGLSEEAEIPILPPAGVPAGADDGARLSIPPGMLDHVLGVPVHAQSAQASQQQQQQRPLSFGIQIKQPQYLIVLDRARAEVQARAKASQLAPRLTPRARDEIPVKIEVVRSQPDFLVVVGGGPRPKSEALLEAVRLKKKYGVNPSLLEVPKE